HSRCFFSACGGTAMMEFVFILPVFLLLIFGAVELARYILITQRVEKAGFVLSDTLTQDTQAELTQANADQVFAQYASIMEPYDDPVRQRVIFTSVSKDPADHQIKIN